MSNIADIQERYYQWAIRAAGKELTALRSLQDSKIGKPGSPYSVALIKIASILKGAGKQINPEQAFTVICENTTHLHIKPREARRMWIRAMKNARPRFPQEN